MQLSPVVGFFIPGEPAFFSQFLGSLESLFPTTVHAERILFEKSVSSRNDFINGKTGRDEGCAEP